MKVGIYGPSGCGKDECAGWLAAHTRLRYWGPTSKVIAPHAAERLKVGVVEAERTRHAHRALWRQIGDELRRDDPAFLARKTLEAGDVNVGVRALVEIAAVRAERLVDLAVWVERPGLAGDETLEFDDRWCDVVLKNDGTLGRLHARLASLANSWGVLRKTAK